IAPRLDPGRSRPRVGHQHVGGRQAVDQRKARLCPGGRESQQLELPFLQWIERRRQSEDRGILLRQEALGGARVEAKKVGVDEMKQLAALPNTDAVEAIALLGAHVVIAEKVV